MRDAATAGRIMVAALGNLSRIGPTAAPASLVADNEIAGFAIAAGALNVTGSRRSTVSNTCGSVKQWCLFAPGEDVNAYAPGGEIIRPTGTSLATPFVAGAAAAVWGAFPNKRGNQIVRRLLDTAVPLDEQGRNEGVSDEYGHGKLDLGAAMNPIGFLSLPMPGLDTIPASGSLIELPPGFTVPSGVSALRGTVAYDEQMFPFLYDLRSAFRKAPSNDGWLRDLLAPSNGILFSMPIGARTIIELAGASRPPGSTQPVAEMGRNAGKIRDYRVHFQPASDLAVAVGRIAATGPRVSQRRRRGSPISISPPGWQTNSCCLEA